MNLGSMTICQITDFQFNRKDVKYVGLKDLEGEASLRNIPSFGIYPKAKLTLNTLIKCMKMSRFPS